jgi:hypothetical protein
MRLLALVLLLQFIALPVFAKGQPPVTHFVTVAQLEQALTAAHSVKDKKLAREISDMRLTQRLSDEEEIRLARTLPGKRSRLTFLAIADESAFLDPPPSEIPNLPPLSLAEQTALINKAIQFAITTTREWPNFFATRITTRFVGTSVVIRESPSPLIEPPGYEGDQRLMSIGTTTVGVVYRDGREEYANGQEGADQECGTGGATSLGEFGEVLAQVAWEVSQGTVFWSRWEQSTDGPLAVFRYTARFVRKFGVICPGNHLHLLPQVTAHGEIDVDPVDGSIRRIMDTEVVRVYAPKWWAGEFHMMVHYGPVDIGGKTYLCPVRNVALDDVTPLVGQRQLDNIAKRYGVPHGMITEELNNVEFANYHVFRATVRILPGSPANPPYPPPPQR